MDLLDSVLRITIKTKEKTKRTNSMATLLMFHFKSTLRSIMRFMEVNGLLNHFLVILKEFMEEQSVKN